MSRFVEVQIESAHLAEDSVVADVRRRQDGSYHPVSRLVVFLECGASVSFDGRFPARAELTSAPEVVDLMKGHRIVSLTHHRERHRHPLATPGLYVRRHVFRFSLEGSSVDLEWAATEDDRFDVDPAPRIEVRPGYRIASAG